jgi:hypothetical protein
MAAASQETVIFDFKNPGDIKTWQIVNDTVMGGVSESSLQQSVNGSALFSGSVSLKNFGGFCSTSSRFTKNHDLTGNEGIAIRVKGDGKNYKLTIKTDTNFSGFAYHYPFVTKKDAWMTIRAPFRDFTARFRGMPVADAPPVNAAEVKSFGLLIGDKQEGPFTLEIESIKAYSE